MKPIFLLLVCFAIALAGLAGFTEYHHGASLTHVLGYPVVVWGSDGGAWLAFGGVGVLVIGVGGGVVALTLYGAGILFGTGQITAGLIALGQGGVGLLFFLGQAGLGLNVAAQGGLGWRRWTQGNAHSKAYFQSMWEELNEVLVPPGFRRSGTTDGPLRR